MTKYIPKDICKKLVRMGCVSESKFYYTIGGLQHCDVHRYGGDLVPAFIPWDFVENSQKARENAKILWPQGIYKYGNAIKVDIARHDCIDSADAVEFIVRSVEAKEKVI